MTKQTIKRIINFSAYIAVVVAAALVILSKFIPNIQNALLWVAGVTCFAVCVFAGGYYAISRRNGAYISLFVLSIIAAIVAVVVL